MASSRRSRPGLSTQRREFSSAGATWRATNGCVGIKKLDDGTLHVEWRFVPVDDGKRYNSGVFVRNSADGRIWHQAQTGDSSGGFLFGETPVNGELKRLKQAGGGVKPAGSGMSSRSRAKGRR